MSLKQMAIVLCTIRSVFLYAFLGIRLLDLVVTILGLDAWLPIFNAANYLPKVAIIMVSIISPSLGDLVGAPPWTAFRSKFDDLSIAKLKIMRLLLNVAFFFGFGGARLQFFMIDIQSWYMVRHFRATVLGCIARSFLDTSGRRVDKKYCALSKTSSNTCAYLECVFCLEDIDSGQKIATHRTCREHYHRQCLHRLLKSCAIGQELCKSCHQPLTRFAVVEYLDGSPLGWRVGLLKSLMRLVGMLYVGAMFLIVMVLPDPNQLPLLNLKHYLIDVLTPWAIAIAFLWIPCNALDDQKHRRTFGGRHGEWSTKDFLPWAVFTYVALHGTVSVFGRIYSRREMMLLVGKGFFMAASCVHGSKALEIPSNREGTAFEKLKMLAHNLWLCISPWFTWITTRYDRAGQSEQSARQGQPRD